MELILRSAQDSDLSCVLKMYKDALSYEGCVWDEEYPNEEILIEDFNSGSLYIFVLKNKIVGAISAIFDGDLDKVKCWKIQSSNPISFARVVVAKKFLGQGYGTKMVEELLKILSDKGYDAVRILVSPLNQSAMAIYRKLGFDFLCIENVHEMDFWVCERRL